MLAPPATVNAPPLSTCELFSPELIDNPPAITTLPSVILELLFVLLTNKLPLTSNVLLGLLVLIPTFPFCKIVIRDSFDVAN